MRKTIWSGMCAATVFAAAMTITAQTSSTSQPPTQPPSSPTPQTAPPPQNPMPQERAENSDRRITVTGCLQQAPPSPTGTSGTADANAAAGDVKFLLTTVASADSAGDPKATGDPKAAEPKAADPKAAPAKMYRLVANEAALSPHVGKKLELTGTLEDQSSSARNPSSASSDAPVRRPPPARRS